MTTFTTTKLTDPADVLEAAADVLDERGWLRGGYFHGGDRGGPVCAIGAIRVVDHGTPRFMSRTQAGLLAERALHDELGRHVPSWNDEQRDKRKVQRAMRRTARKLRGAKR